MKKLIIYDVAEVEDFGEYYIVVAVGNNDLYEFNGAYTIKLNSLTADYIKYEKSLGKEVRIPKDFPGTEVMKRDVIIISNNTNDLEFEKMKYVSKIRQSISNYEANVSGIQMYDYININNYLNNKGYFIHDDNKEETYLEILETGDEELIDKLEIYLNARDDISRSSAMEKIYSKFFQEMNEQTTLEDSTELYKKMKEKIKEYNF